MDLKNEILEIINKPNYNPLTIEDFSKILKNDNKEDLINSLNELVASSNLFLNKKKDRYLNRDNLGYHVGKISIRNPHFGFISSNDFHYDFYVEKNNFNDAFDNDEVLFMVTKSDRNYGSHSEAKVIKVLKRELEMVVGKVYQKKNNYYLDTKNFYKNDIFLKINDLNGAKIDDLVNVKITRFIYQNLEGDVVSVIGSSKAIGSDLLAIANKYGFSTTFPNEVIKVANSLSWDKDKERSRRKSSLDKTIYTIDGDDSKDLDDAISVKRLDNGNYFLGVYIADVSYFVTEGSPIDKEAFSRSTSLYLCDTVIPMLPFKLSNDLCSLNPQEEKLAIACEMEIDNKGNVLESNIFETIIMTKKRLSYSKCNKVLDGISVDKEYDSIKDDLELMLELSDVIGDAFDLRGMIDFDIPEGKIELDENGNVINVIKRERGLSEKIIENFMITANEAVASFIESLDLPFIYRVHDKPDVVKLFELKSLAQIMGYSIRTMHPSEVKRFLSSVKEEDEFLKLLTLRLMPKAIYSEDNIGHFGLGSRSYTHFTSPIRRYPDLIVHRLLRKYLFNHEIDENEFSLLETKIHDIGVWTSKKERDSIQCEYDVEDAKKCLYMSKFIGEKFIGRINSITNFGMFVTLDNTVEGMVRIRDMKDDYYIFDTNLFQLRGERTNRKFRVGDLVIVRLDDVNLKDNEINFSLVYNNSSSGKKYGKENHRKK